MSEVDMDQAQEADNRLRQQAIDRARRAMNQNATGREDCIDCGEMIPEGRRKAVPGCIRCVECAKLNERLREGL